MKVVRLSASRTGSLYPQEIFPVLIFTRDLVDPRAMVQSEGNMSLKNPMKTPGNFFRCLYICPVLFNDVITAVSKVTS